MGGMRINGAVALVTGASSCLGRATAELLAARGAKVLVHGRDQAALDTLARRIGGVPLVADFAVPGAAEELAREAVKLGGRVDLLVANAGAGWAGSFDAMGHDDIETLVTANLTAPIRLTRAL